MLIKKNFGQGKNVQSRGSRGHRDKQSFFGNDVLKQEFVNFTKNLTLKEIFLINQYINCFKDNTVKNHMYE